MFDTTIFDTLESAPRSRRWTTAFSFMLQAIAVTALLLIPLLYTDALPSVHYSEQLTVPPGPAPQRPIELVATPPQQRSDSEIVNERLMAPSFIPIHAINVVDPPNFGSNDSANGPSVPGGTGTPGPNDAIQRMIAVNVPPPPRPDVHRAPIRVSSLSEGAILKRVQPIYPSPARAARIQGPVVMAALIDVEGRIFNLRVISGNPLLVNAAMDAVKQWRYRPYVLNAQPIEVETQITVVFSLK